MPDADALDISAEIGLLWLRSVGGVAFGDFSGRVWIGAQKAPVTFRAFERLNASDLVEITATAFGVSSTRQVIAVTSAGTAFATSDEANARYRQLMHGRFED